MNYPNRSRNIKQNFTVTQKARGAVLILAILIVALVAGLGIKFAGDYQLGLARAEGRWHGVQGRTYGASVEDIAIVLLKDDDPEVDHPDEQWAQPQEIPVEGGIISVSMKDANSQLDLNSLLGNLQGDDPRNPARYSSSQRMFIRLLQTFPELVRSESEATDIMEAVVDWADTNSDSSGNGGAEESYYSGLVDPYLPANSGQFRSVEELQMVRGITPELMKALRPYITLLPSNGTVNGQPNIANASQGANSSAAKGGNNSSKNGGKNTVNPDPNNPNNNAANNAGQLSNATQLLNINTLPLQLLRTINVKTSLQPLDEQQVSTLERLKPESGHYSNMGELDSTLAKIGSTGDFDKDNLTVKTDSLWLIAQAQIGNQRRTIRSLLTRGAGSPLFSVVRREDVYLY